MLRTFKLKAISEMMFSLLLVCMLSAAFNVVSSTPFQSHDQSTYARDDASAIYIGNDLIEIGFRKDTGALWSILHKASGVDLRGLKEDLGEGLWDLTFLTEELKHIRPSGIRRSHPYYRGYSVKQTSNEVEITLEWSKVWLEDCGEYPARVVISMKVLKDSPLARCSIEIENLGSAAIEEVWFPTIYEVSKLGSKSTDDVFVVPDQNGRIFHNPSESLEWWGHWYPSGFLNMQFMAYYDSKAGFYFATYDNDANTKFFYWHKPTWIQGINIGIVHYPTINFGQNFSLTYDVALGVFSGDWYTAADIYKKWALNQWWSYKNVTSTWLQEIAVSKDFYLYFTGGPRNRTFAEFIKKIKQHQEYFNLPTLAMLWGWEKRGAWSSGDYFPPYEGWSKFDELVQEAHNTNAKLWLFINAWGILTNSEPWTNGTAKPYAVTDENGSYRTVFVPEQHTQAVFICPFTDYWRNALKWYVLTLIRHGVDMIQFDGLPWVPPQPCYNDAHGHPFGLGGNWYAKAWFSVLSEIREAARHINPDVAFSGEGGSEVFIPFLHVYHSRDSWAEVFDDYVHRGTADVIPLFNYVYHDSLIFIGEHNLALWRPLGGSSYNRLGLSRILTWGEIPSYNMQESLYDPNVDAELVDYVKKIGCARTTYARSFLSYSVPVRPVEITSPLIQVRDEKGSNYNVASLQYNALMAHDGSIGYLLTNIANTNIEVGQQIDVTIPTPYNVYLVRDGKLEWTDLSTNRSYTFSLTIKPLEIVLLIFAPADTVPPVADAGSNQTVPEDTAVTFDGSASWDNVWIVNYTWTFKDGDKLITLTGVTPTYNFTTPGVYVVTLNVTDVMGNYDTDTIVIKVLDVTPPVADAGSDRTVLKDAVVIFNGSRSSDNVGIINYLWDFGDGTTGTGIITTHAYREPGTYTVTLTVKDSAGNSNMDLIIMTVEAVPAEFPWWIVGFIVAGVVLAVALILRRFTKGKVTRASTQFLSSKFTNAVLLLNFEVRLEVLLAFF